MFMKIVLPYDISLKEPKNYDGRIFHINVCMLYHNCFSHSLEAPISQYPNETETCALFVVYFVLYEQCT